MPPNPRAWLNRLLGDRGERAAARFLRRRGMRIITRGYRTNQGEIDLIARDGDMLVFVEVKTRRRGDPAEAVTPRKLRRLRELALRWLDERQIYVPEIRFDVISIMRPPHGRPTLEHLRGVQ